MSFVRYTSPPEIDSAIHWNKGTATLNWNDYKDKILGKIGDLAKLSPDTVGRYMMASGAGAKTGNLNAKTRELISLAVAATTRCDGCIAVHSANAVNHGATREEVAEASGVAVAMNAGAALVYSARALDAFDAVST